MATVKYLDENGLSTVWSKVKGIVTPKADKVSGATAGHLAGLNSSGNLTDSGLAATNIAQKDGSYSGMTVGAAEDLVSAESVASEFTSRITGGSTAVGKGGTALVDKIKGRTLVWNQLVQNGAATVQSGHKCYKRINGVASIATSDGASISAPNSGDMVIDLTLMFGAGNEPATAEEFEALYPGPYYDYNAGELINNAASGIETVGFNQWDEEWEQGLYSPSDGSKTSSVQNFRCKNIIPVIPGSTYYFKTRNNEDYRLRICTYDHEQNFISAITGGALNSTVTFNNNVAYISICSLNGSTPTYTNGLVCINLSDPSRNGTYEPYWRSELELGLGDIKVKSHNLWDEEWENGEYDTTTGAKAGSTYVRTKNYIPVESSTSYYFYKGNNFSNVRVFEYDANQAYIQNTYKISTSGFILTTASNTKYVTFYTWTDTSYANNICINLSDPAFNGRYEPYGDGGVISITGGLKSAGVAYDEISGGKYIKRVGSVDMGDLSYLYRREVEGGGVFSSTSIADKANGVSDQMYANVVCPMYVAAKSTTGVTLVRDRDNMTICDYAGASNIIYVKNLSYTGATAFKEAMSGVPLYYDLAQPIEYELAEAIPTAMRNDPYGTERRLPEDTAAIVTAPFRADITYSTNIKEAVQSMHQNFINVNSMQDFLAALGALMGGTWTMSPADGKFDFTFTPNPSNE